MSARPLAASAILLLLAAPAAALSMGQASLTPDLEVPPVHHFRIDTGLLAIDEVHSLRREVQGMLYGPYFSLTYGAAPNVALTIDGMPYKFFAPHRARGSESVGDFAVWGKILLGNLGGRSGYGIRFGAKMPNTPSNKDFGTNQTDFFMHVFAGTRGPAWRVSGYGGIGILERPRGEESQDDVAMFGVLLSRTLPTGILRFEGEGFTKSQIYGDNFALHASYEHEITQRLALHAGGQVSTGRFYGRGELRLGIVLHI